MTQEATPLAGMPSIRTELRSNKTLLVIHRTTPFSIAKGRELASSLRNELEGARSRADDYGSAAGKAAANNAPEVVLVCSKLREEAMDRAALTLHCLGGLASVWCETAIPRHSVF